MVTIKLLKSTALTLMGAVVLGVVVLPDAYAQEVIKIQDETLDKNDTDGSVTIKNIEMPPLPSSQGKDIEETGKPSDIKLDSEEKLDKQVAGATKEQKNIKTANQKPQGKRIPSLFFTYWQYQSILDALQSHGSEKYGDGFNELTEAEKTGKPEEEKIKPENREVFLSGIVFVNEKEWTIWINGKRVTPLGIPPEIIDLKVFKAHIDLKWYDEYTNKIYPIRIRPHQRFNLDTRVFLPG